MPASKKKVVATPVAIEQEKIDTTVRDISKEKLGVVSKCSVLNVRKIPNPTGEVLFTISRGTQVKIDLLGSTESYYRVVIQGVEGFCRKDFIEV